VTDDLTTPVVGWRAWRVGPDQLESIVYSDSVWLPGKPINAVCAWQGTAAETPSRDCGCGIHATKTMREAMTWLRPCRMPGCILEHRHTALGARILGRVALWGKVIEHKNGWRGEFAYPQVFYAEDEYLVEVRARLAAFGVPILPRSALEDR